MDTSYYQVVYQPQVKQALDEIAYHYNQKGGRDLAEKMLDNIIFQLDKLEFMPHRCQATDFCEHIRKMTIQTPPYLAYYTVVDAEVRILELIHASRNQDLVRQKYENFTPYQQ